MRNNAGFLAACLLLGAASSGLAQGVPVIDGTNLAKNIEQLQAALQDAENQVAQIEELKKEVQNGLDQIANLKGILGSISGLNEIASLYNSVQDLRSRAAKITDLSGFTKALELGDFSSLTQDLLDGQVTMGDKTAADYMEDTLANAGLTSERLAGLSSSANPQDKGIAATAAASATAMGMAQMSYDEAGESLARIDGLVAEIGNQETLKDSIDLNTRMAAETSYILGQMWRLNAAAGLASGQSGVNWAAEQAKEKSFFDYSGSR